MYVCLFVGLAICEANNFDINISKLIGRILPRQLSHTGGDAVHDIQTPWSNNPG